MRALHAPFELVDAATTLPYGCICGKCQGQLVRTHLDLPQGEGYIGPECVADLIALHNYVKIDTLHALQRQYAAVNEQLVAAERDGVVRERRTAELEQEVERLTGRVQELDSERVSVQVEAERVGRELNAARLQLAATAELRAGRQAIEQAAAGKRPKQMRREKAA